MKSIAPAPRAGHRAGRRGARPPTGASWPAPGSRGRRQLQGRASGTCGESPALPLIAGLIREGADVGYYDPLMPVLRLPDGQVLTSDAVTVRRRLRPRRGRTRVHPAVDYSWAHDCPLVLDATYQFGGATHRAVV